MARQWYRVTFYGGTPNGIAGTTHMRLNKAEVKLFRKKGTVTREEPTSQAERIRQALAGETGEMKR